MRVGMTVDEIETLCDLLGCDFADIYEGKPLNRYGVKIEQVGIEDFETVCRVNRIARNLSEMRRLLDYNPSNSR